LSDLKQQLLEKALPEISDPWQRRLLRLAAIEADALACWHACQHGRELPMGSSAA
jgi:hypothetical protein